MDGEKKDLNSDEKEDKTTSAFAYIEESLRGLKFGQVTIIVQNGVIVQIDRTERRRLA